MLFLSVWLTYAADRLFDVRGRSPSSLHSLRHKWTKRYAKQLWRIWFLILSLNCLLALSSLQNWQIQQGIWLLCLCLLYTALNQRLARYWFPKEIFVGAIFSAGVLIFFPLSGRIEHFLLLASVFFLNCLLVSLKERTIDAALGDRSLSTAPTRFLFLILTAFLVVYLTLAQNHPKLTQLSVISLLSLGGLFLCRKKCTTQADGILADCCLLPAPIFALLFS